MQTIPARRRNRARMAAAVLAASAALGCGTTKMTSTARTGTEQILLTNAWDDALRKVDFRPLTGVPVFLDTQYIEAVDKGWITSTIRQAMLAQGVLMRTKPEQAQWVVEARVGAYGTDSNNWLFGVPQVTVPPTFTGMPTGTIPEIPIVKRTEQQAISKLALFAYDRASGQITWTSGTMLATSNAKDVYVGGVGPIQSGSIRSGPEFVGVRLPTISDPNASATTASPPQRSDVPFHSPNLSLPSNAADLDSFAP